MSLGRGSSGQLDSSNDVYDQGGIFVRYLIRTYGIDAFLRYYEQSPEQRDSALFAANFQSFWNLSLDGVWTAIHTPPPGALPVAETKICPCSLPPLEASGAVTNDPALAPYWPLADTGSGTLALGAAAGQRVWIRDCAGIREPLIGKGVLARLGGAEPRYVLPPLETATVDSYVADDLHERGALFSLAGDGRHRLPGDRASEPRELSDFLPQLGGELLGRPARWLRRDLRHVRV